MCLNFSPWANELRLASSTIVLSYVSVVIFVMSESLLTSRTFPVVG